MQDYYEELGLNPGMSLDEIKDELARQENKWTARNAGPAAKKAGEMLALLNRAKEVFRTEAARAEYDRELEQSRRQPARQEAPAQNREESFQGWKARMRQLYDNSQYDVAKEAFEKALGFQNSARPDIDFYNLGTEIYWRLRDYHSALYWINQILLYEQENPVFYLEKADILIGRAANGTPESRMEDYKQAMDAAESARNVAQKLQDDRKQGEALGLKAYIWLAADNSILYREPDCGELETLARQALELCPDDQGARYVLDRLYQAGMTGEQIAERRRQKQEAAEEARRKVEEARRHREKMASIRKKLVWLHVALMAGLLLFTADGIHIVREVGRNMSAYIPEIQTAGRWREFLWPVLIAGAAVTDLYAKYSLDPGPLKKLIHGIDLLLLWGAGFVSMLLSSSTYISWLGVNGMLEGSGFGIRVRDFILYFVCLIAGFTLNEKLNQYLEQEK